jgi:hypothetical protein
MTSDLKQPLQCALQTLLESDFRSGNLNLLQTLGYFSNKTFPIDGAKPKAFLEMLEDSPNGDAFDRDKPLFADWKKADLLFQLTNEELSGERSLFEATEVKPGLLRSYLFFAIIRQQYAGGALH